MVGPQQVQPVIEPVAQRRQADDAHAARGELDGEGEAVEPADELGDVADDVRRGLEVGGRCSGSFQEQRHRWHVRIGGAGAGQPERGQGVDLLDLEPEPLAAGGQHTDTRTERSDPGRQVADRGEHVLAVVQHEQPGRRLQSPVERSLGAPAREDLDPQGGGDHGAHACLGRDAGQVGPPRDLLGGGDGSRKGGLADSAGADDGDALVASGEDADLLDGVVAADEPASSARGLGR